jgi:hypothetical protein
LARELLVRYGDDKKLRTEIMANFLTEGFSGSEVEHYTRKKETLLNIQKNEDNLRVNQFIDEMVISLNVDIERAQKFEERFDF